MFRLVLLLSLVLVSLSLKLPNFNANKVVKKTNEIEIIKPDYKVPIGFLGLGALSTAVGNFGLGVPLAAVGTLLTVQAGRVKFLFDNEALEIKIDKGEQGLDDSRQNFVVGGKNRWNYKTITQWFFIPSKEAPVLMYFKETQTKPEGQSHLFPVIMNGKQLYNAMMKNVGNV